MLDENEVRIIQFKEREKTYQTAIICGTVCTGVIAICAAAVLISGRQEWWIALILGILSILIGNSPAVALSRGCVTRFRRFMDEFGRSKIELEILVDSERESSGINPDGTHSND